MTVALGATACAKQVNTQHGNYQAVKNALASIDYVKKDGKFIMFDNTSLDHGESKKHLSVTNIISSVINKVLHLKLDKRFKKHNKMTIPELICVVVMAFPDPTRSHYRLHRAAIDRSWPIHVRRQLLLR
jgi:hypothetical protein